MSLITRFRTLTFSVLTAMVVAAPACDDGADYEALGVTVQDLAAMSAEELDALDGELATLGLGEEDSTPRPHVRPGATDELMIPLRPTHAERPHVATDLKVPTHPTHTGEVPAPATDAFAAEPDEMLPCDTHGDDVDFAAE